MRGDPREVPAMPWPQAVGKSSQQASLLTTPGWVTGHLLSSQALTLDYSLQLMTSDDPQRRLRR